ncbi:MAG: aminopeptidase N [Alphaproteobacteria bacterium]|nr:aminopeptidase N [Alphaproteobacteria bacterium]
MRTDTPQTIYLKDYKPSPYQISHIDLNFDLHEGYAIVTAKTQFTAEPHTRDDLFLYGEDLELLEITIDGTPVQGHVVTDKGVTIPCPHKAEFTLEIKTRIHPENNTRLEGLYKSGGTYCTQCEAEGFRRITYYLDRPDIMAMFTTRLEASKEHYPVLLSNGNRVDHGDAGHGRHFAVWHDPFPKPCYLFALVAGDLTHIHDTYTTKSGRMVDLYIYVRPGDEGQCGHAMESLKKSMKWDEDVYGLEYDLDLFNIVAVSDFNMGAMENKSLNIFNTALVFAQQDTATDRDYIQVESVVAHEYFHNWSGNRVTCRDWFQLSLKEGLTVFRDQEFSSDLNSRPVQRIDDVAHLRRLQFPEDAGPLAHPIRPDNYIEINNFYTMTVYEKGAEVIRMTRTLLGPDNYRKATDLYFSRHDGQAVTCDDWLKCMEDASGVDLSQFKLWYSQAGTPEVTFKGEYDEAAQTYIVTLTQKVPPTPGQIDKKPMHIPVKIGLLGPDGTDLVDEILHLKENNQEFIFKNIKNKPVPSVFRNFSAPVTLKTDLSDEDLRFLMVHDSDGFNRWEAGQTYMLNVINGMIDGGNAVPEKFLSAYGDMLRRASDKSADKALAARALSLPDVSRIGQTRDVVDPEAINAAREAVLYAIKGTYKERLKALYDVNRSGPKFATTPEAMGQRALQNTLLGILTSTRGTGCATRAKSQYDNANNMTDRLAALARLADMDCPERESALLDFYERFESYPLVIDKWFAVQAMSGRDAVMSDLEKLYAHPQFTMKNPNRVRSLYASFAMNNPVKFHAANGEGYEFLRDAVIRLNSINPQIGARMLNPLREWRRYTPDRQKLMRSALEEILKTPNIAPDIFEIAKKSVQ